MDRASRLNRRRLLQLAGVAAAGSLLAACGGGTTGSTSTPAAATGTAGAPVGSPTSAAGAAGGAAPTVATNATVTVASASTTGKEKSAVVYFGFKPYANWTGIRFWTNTGIPARMQWEPLLDIDDDLKPAPGLAESWEVVSSTVTRYHLRSGLKWSDGTPITAQDIVFSMGLTFSKDLSTLMSTEIATIKGGADVQSGSATTVSGVRALDDQTVEIESTVPDTSILRTLALRWWAPIPMHIYQNIKPADLLKSPDMTQPKVVSGPFKIDRIEPDKWYEMSANTSYWRGKAKLDKVTYVFGNIGDPVALASQQKFDYYIARTPDIAAQLAKNPNYNVKTVEYIQPGRRQLNAGLPKYADPRVRKALAYAIDRETIAKQIYQGAATAQYTDFLGDILDPSAEVYKYNPDMARKLLKDANWNPADVMLLDNTAPVAGAAADPIGDAENAAYQQWLQDVGIKSQVRLSPDAASFSDLTLNGNFDCYENPHRRYDTYGPLEMKIYLLSSPRNYANWKSADADALVAQAVGETDPQKYIAAAKKLSILAADQCPYIPTKASLWGIVSRKQFVGFTPIGEAYFAHTKPYNWDVVG